MEEYKTPLTEQQYRSNFGRLNTFGKIFREKLDKGEISKKEFFNKILEYARKLRILIIDDPNDKNFGKKIVHPEEIFNYQKEIDGTRDISRLSGARREYKSYEKDIDVSIPKRFVTLGERSAPCSIVYRPNVKKLMLDSIDYSNKVGREVHYTLCETPTGIKVSSPAFGSSSAVSRRTEKTRNKCPAEFGKDSREIGEFHTHPGIGYEEFSVTDLQSYSDDPYEYNNSNCIVSKQLDKKGNKNIRVRCTSGSNAQRFLGSIDFKDSNLTFEEYTNKIGQKFYRDPHIQDAFSCIVDFPESKSEKQSLSKRNISTLSIPEKRQVRREIRKIAKKSPGFDFGEGFNL